MSVAVRAGRAVEHRKQAVWGGEILPTVEANTPYLPLARGRKELRRKGVTQQLLWDEYQGDSDKRGAVLGEIVLSFLLVMAQSASVSEDSIHSAAPWR